MDLKRPSYQRTVRWTMQGLTEPISLAVVILQRRKVVRCVQFYWTRGLFLKNRTTLPKKRSVSSLKTVDLDYRSSLSVARLVRFKFDRPRQIVSTI